MPNLHVTTHAIERYQERVRPCSEQDARQALQSEAFQIAADFGNCIVRLATGQGVVIVDHTVVTVLPPEHYKRRIQRCGLGRYGKTNYAKDGE